MLEGMGIKFKERFTTSEGIEIWLVDYPNDDWEIHPAEGHKDDFGWFLLTHKKTVVAKIFCGFENDKLKVFLK